MTYDNRLFLNPATNKMEVIRYLAFDENHRWESDAELRIRVRRDILNSDSTPLDRKIFPL